MSNDLSLSGNWENNYWSSVRFTLYRTAIIQKSYIDLILAEVNLMGKILEAGFGSATTLTLLSDLGYDVYGFENSDVLIKQAIERFSMLRGKLFNGDILDDDSYKERYSAIIHQGVLEHFSDNEILRILAVQSQSAEKIIFDIPNNQRKLKTYPGIETRYESPTFWEDIITSAGLKFQRFGRNLDKDNDLLPETLKKYDSSFMKKYGRSSMFVCSI